MVASVFKKLPMKLIKLNCLILALTILSSCGGIKRKSKAVSLGVMETVHGYPIIGVWSDIGKTGHQGIPLNVSKEFNDQEMNEFIKMAALWDAASSGQRKFIKINTTKVEDLQNYSGLKAYKTDELFGIYKRNEWFSGVNASSIAITQYVVEQRGEGFPTLVHADIILNNEKFTFGFVGTTVGESGPITKGSSPLNQNGKIGPYDIASVVLHALSLPRTAEITDIHIRPFLKS